MNSSFHLQLQYFLQIGWMGKIFSKLRLETAKRTDERIRTMNEVISAMRIIKMYTWEKSFAKLISHCRLYLSVYQFSANEIRLNYFIFRNEINTIRRTNYFRALNISLFITSSKFMVFLTFLVLILTGNHLTAEKVTLKWTFWYIILLII